MSLRAFLRWVLLCVAVISSLHAQTAPSADLAAELQIYEQRVNAALVREHIPGVTVGFIKDGQVWVKAFGLSDLENKVPAKPESAYRYASVQKSMTAVAVMQLVEAGKMDLDAEVQQYVPYFPKKKRPVTIRELLTHTAGIPHYVNRDIEQHFKDHKTTKEAVAVFEMLFDVTIDVMRN